MTVSDISKAGFSGTAAVAIVALMVGVSFAGSTLVTPLYVIYEQAFGFSRIVLTLIYAAYVIGNLAALLFIGQLSDQIGRRATAIPALVICAVSAVTFLFAGNVSTLIAARIFSGFGVGIAAGAGTAWLAELVGQGDKARASTIATGSNFLGIALAPLLSGVLADFAPAPLKLSFIVYLVVVVATTALIWFTRETVSSPKPLARASMRPRVGVPDAIRLEFIAPALAGAGAMALIGFFAGLMPSILAEGLHIKSHALAGAMVCELGLMVAAAIFVTRKVSSRTAMTWALWLMLPSTALLVTGQATASLPVMLVATAFCGVASGMGYRGSMQVVNELAPGDRRAEVLSAYFICCFTGNSVPVIGVGIITMQAGPLAASASFAVLIALFALAALGLSRKYRS